MECFTNILVGIDLSQSRPLEITGFSAGVRETIQTAIWLARAGKAKLQFFAAFNLTEEALHHLDPEDRSQVKRTIEEKAREVLDNLVRQAQDQGIKAGSKLALGKARLEITRQVLLDKHDLVVVGTREISTFRRMLFGNTALKLLRRCPCPVWICKPGRNFSAPHILVATDLKPGSEPALGCGVSLGHLLKAKVHLLHVVEYPLDRLGWSGLPDAITMKYHQRVRLAAEKTLQQQLEKTAYKTLGEDGQVHFADDVGIPDVTILHYLERYNIDLLVMGTTARGGFLIGNTAERLLPEVHCSILAVKAPDFQGPVTLPK